MDRYSKLTFCITMFSKSSNKLFKYTANLQDGKSLVKIHFGSIGRDGIPYEQYQDRTGMGLYSEYDNYNAVKSRSWYVKNKNYISKDYWTSKSLEHVFLQKC